MIERIRLEDGTSFPVVLDDDELEWRCRHAELSEYDKLRCGGIIEAYLSLINMPLSLSRRKLSMIKRKLKETTK